MAKNFILQLNAPGLPQINAFFDTMENAMKIKRAHAELLENCSLEKIRAFEFSDDYGVEFTLAIPMYGCAITIDVAQSYKHSKEQKEYSHECEGKGSFGFSKQ